MEICRTILLCAAQKKSFPVSAFGLMVGQNWLEVGSDGGIWTKSRMISANIDRPDTEGQQS